MKFFNKNEEKRRKAKIREMQKFLIALTDFNQTNSIKLTDDMKEVLRTFQDQLKEFLEIIPQLEKEIEEKRALGEDNSSLEKTREDLFKGYDELNKTVRIILIDAKIME